MGQLYAEVSEGYLEALPAQPNGDFILNSIDRLPLPGVDGYRRYFLGNSSNCCQIEKLEFSSGVTGQLPAKVKVYDCDGNETEYTTTNDINNFFAGNICFNSFALAPATDSFYLIKVRLTDCEDDGEWCYTFDADGLEDWSKIDYTGWTPPYIGNYSPGVGWVNSQMVLPGGGSGDCRTDGIAIRKTFTPRIVTEIDTLYDWTNGTFAGSCGAARRVSILGFRNGVLQFDTGLEGSITNGTNKTTNWQGSAELDEIIVRGDPSYYRPSGGGSDGVFVLKEVLVRGEGTNPFGDDTCS